MKETRRYFSNGINESLGTLRTKDHLLNPVYEAVETDDIVVKGNADAVARKIKKLTGCKVIFEDENLLCSENNKVIVRNALSGRRTVEDLVRAVKKFAETMEAKKKDIKESVAERFASYRHLYESEDEGEEDKSEDEDSFNLDMKEPDEEPKDKDNDGTDEKNDEEDIPMTAVVLTVKKDDGQKLKDELIEAGIPEDDIDVIEDDEDDKVKVDANSVEALKDFLKDAKGIDLEEKLGGEIIDDDNDDDKKEEKPGDEDDLDFGSDELDSLFGADDESADEQK